MYTDKFSTFGAPEGRSSYLAERWSVLARDVAEKASPSVRPRMGMSTGQDGEPWAIRWVVLPASLYPARSFTDGDGENYSTPFGAARRDYEAPALGTFSLVWDCETEGRYGGPGRVFTNDATVKRTRTRVLVKQYSSLDI